MWHSWHSTHSWFLAFHLLGLFVYLGGLLTLSRLLAYHVKESPEVRARLSHIEKRMYFFATLPGLIVALTFGLLMLFGVDTGASVGDYLRSHNHDGSVSYWYVTFHAKLVLVFILVCLDIYMGRQVVKLAQGGEPPSPRRFKIIHGLIALIMILIVLLMIVGPFKGDGPWRPNA